MRSRIIKILGGLSWLMLSASLPAAQTVLVGVVVFPPYIVKSAGSTGETLSVELLDLMNAFQQQYHFEAVSSGPVRRFKDFDLGKYDLSTFDSLEWGWKGRPVEASEVYLHGAEVYVALVEPGRDERYFSDFNHKAMIGMLGYHYGFAGFDNSPEMLRREFNMQLTNDNESTIKLLLAGRGDIAVVTEAYLNGYLARHPEDRAKLLISKRKDQTYAHTIIVRKGIRPTVEEINNLLRAMRKAGVLDPLWKKYGADPAAP